MAEQMKKVADHIADYLAERGIRYVFGIVGAGDAQIFDAITRRGYTQIVCVHHEQAATMAMQSYYRVSGEVTVALVTTGGGTTNTITGVVGAWMDSMPAVVIAGNEKSVFCTQENKLRIWGVQGYDSISMVKGVTKYAKRVTAPNETIQELEKAFTIAEQPRTGPCWLEIPMDIQAAKVKSSDLLHYAGPSLTAPDKPEGLIDKVVTNPDEAADKALAMLRKAKRPVIWLGHGIRLAGAVDLIPSLLSGLQCPALVSWTGIDMIDSDNPYVFGRAGVYGQRAANFILQNCDCLITIGTRLSLLQVGYEISEFARAAEVLQVDIDLTELEKYQYRMKHLVQLDAKVFMQHLLKAAKQHYQPHTQSWLARCREYQKAYPAIGPEHADKKGFINSYQFMDKLSKLLKPDQVVVTDMGTALLSGHQALQLKLGQRLITSQGLGEMGYGLPGAIGASFARDKGEVLCLNCDGGMMMNLQELQTVVHHQLPIKIIIFNNDGYLMIKHTQKALFQGRYSGTNPASGVSCPDYAALAKAFGIPAFQIRTWDDFNKTVPTVLAEKGPVICEVFMDPEQLFVPKLSLAQKADGTIVSPPLEDLSPVVPMADLQESMLIDIHPKSKALREQ